MKHRNQPALQAIVTIVCFLTGVVMAAQWRTQATIRQTPILASPVEQAYMVRNLVEGNARLRSEVEQLETQVIAFQEDNRQASLQVLVEELTRLKVANGLVEVNGPGVQITLDGEISVYDLQDMVNELRNAGAEAISLNGQRIVAASIVAAQGQRTVVDGVTVTGPYLLQAVGDPETIEEAITRRGGILDLMKGTYSGLHVQTEHRQSLVLPVFRRPYQFVHAAVVR